MADGKGFEPFWACPEGEIARNTWARQKALEDQSEDMRRDNWMFLAIATNGNVDGSGQRGSEFTRYRLLNSRIRKNIVAALIDTAASRVAGVRTLPQYTTTRADFSVRDRAEQRQECLFYQANELGFFNLSQQVFYDAARCGTGGVRTFVDPVTGRTKIARVKTNSVLVDWAEWENPRTMTYSYCVPRDYLASQYSKFRSQVRDAEGPDSLDFERQFVQDTSVDLVKVVEAWHLPSGGDANDGRWVITTNNATLHVGVHERDRFPIQLFNMFDRPLGFFGQGYVERALSAQARYWQLQGIIDRCEDLGSNLVFLVPDEGDVESSQMTNLPGIRISYSNGAKPEAVLWSGSPQDLIAQQQRIWTDLLDQEGFSPGTASGELPQKGLSSGRAVRASHDVSSQRHIPIIKRFEDWQRRVFIGIEDANDDCAEKDNGFTVSGRARAGRASFLQSSKWKELALPPDDVKISVFGVNALAHSPEAQIEAIEELVAQGAMTRPQAYALYGVPDLPAWSQLETAQEDMVQHQIELLRGGKRALPIANQAAYIAEAKRTVNNAYLVAVREGAPEEVKQLFRDYLAYCDVIVPPAPTPEEAASAAGAPLLPEAAAPAPAL